MTARHIFMIAGLLLALSATPAFAQTAKSDTPLNKKVSAEAPRVKDVAPVGKNAHTAAPPVTNNTVTSNTATSNTTPNNKAAPVVTPAPTVTAATAPAPATTPANKPAGIAGWFSSLGKSANKTSTTAAVATITTANSSQTQRHVHTYLARNYDHRPGHTYAHGKGAVGTTTAVTPASSSGGFFSRFKKSTSQ